MLRREGETGRELPLGFDGHIKIVSALLPCPQRKLMAGKHLSFLARVCSSRTLHASRRLGFGLQTPDTLFSLYRSLALSLACAPSWIVPVRPCPTATLARSLHIK
jgi:hypothetical protein